MPLPGSNKAQHSLKIASSPLVFPWAQSTVKALAKLAT